MSYKLYYFESRGRAEPSRIILACAGVKYEDVRYTKEQWAEFKPKTPFGSMPVWEEDGKMLAGSTVIARYLGEKYGLAGGNAWENAQVANIVDFISDFGREISKVFFEKDEEKKKELLKNFKSEVAPKFLGKLNELANNDSSFLWGNKPTWADFILFAILEPRGFCNALGREDLSSYPALEKFVSTISALPNIVKWIKERPDSTL